MLYNMQKYLSHIISFIFKQFHKINKSVSIVIPNLQVSETEALRDYVNYPRLHQHWRVSLVSVSLVRGSIAPSLPFWPCSKVQQAVPYGVRGHDLFPHKMFLPSSSYFPEYPALETLQQVSYIWIFKLRTFDDVNMCSINVGHKCNCSLLSISSCQRSFSSIISYLFSLPQLVALLACSLHGSPCVPAAVLCYHTFQGSIP